MFLWLFLVLHSTVYYAENQKLNLAKPLRMEKCNSSLYSVISGHSYLQHTGAAKNH